MLQVGHLQLGAGVPQIQAAFDVCDIQGQDEAGADQVGHELLLQLAELFRALRVFHVQAGPPKLLQKIDSGELQGCVGDRRHLGVLLGFPQGDDLLQGQIGNACPVVEGHAVDSGQIQAGVEAGHLALFYLGGDGGIVVFVQGFAEVRGVLLPRKEIGLIVEGGLVALGPGKIGRPGGNCIKLLQLLEISYHETIVCTHMYCTSFQVRFYHFSKRRTGRQ